MSLKDTDALRRMLAEIDPSYEPVRELGRGATSIVYLVRDTALDRNVAVKVIRSSFGPDPEAVARLEREARLVAQLQHPNIVRLYGTRTMSDGSLVLLMEHVPGRNLRELVQAEGALDVPRVLSILDDVASALAYAHRRRIVHRDVKPENIYLDEEVGTARLADFGVAKPWDRDTRLTLPGESLGTPAYMSPEQIDDAPVDGRSDVYSLGMVGYEMLAGGHPWDGENLYSIIFKQKNETLPSLRVARADVPAALIEVLERALKKHPESRWASAEDMLDRIRELDTGGRPGSSGMLDGAPAALREPWIDRTWDEEVTSRPEPAPPPVPEPTPLRQPEPQPRPEPQPLETLPDPAPTREPETTSDVEPTREPEPVVAPPPPVHAAPANVPRPRRRKDGGDRRRTVGWVAAGGVVLFAAGAWWMTRGSDDIADPESLAQMPEPGAAPAATEGPGSSTEQGASAADLSLSAAGPVVIAGRIGELVPVEVRVRSDDGLARAGVPVRFVSPEGATLIEPDSVATDQDGLASAGARLPGTPGVSTVFAHLVTDSLRRVRFELRALAGEPQALTPLLGGGQEGVPGEFLAQPLGVRVVDQAGNPVGGTAVAFQVLMGEGQIVPARAVTDSLGRAFARWRLGGGAGAQQARAVVEGATGVQAAEFEATAEAPAPDSDDPTAGDTSTPAADPDPLDAGPVEPAGAAPFVTVGARPLAVGGAHVCRAAGAAAACRGANDRGQGTGAGAPSPMVALAAGVTHTCGLGAQGEAFCWGGNDSGQLGDGSRADRAAPVAVAGDWRYQMLAAGLSHTCGLDGAGTVYCWGRNVAGQLGDGSREDHAEPRPVAGSVRLRTLAAGWNHTCGIDASGVAWCWGLNGDGQLGDGTRLDRLIPVRMPASPPFQVLTAGNAHTCGVTGGEVRCWGSNSNGQLGTGDTQASTQAAVVQGLPGPVTRVAAGAMHTCALLGDGQVYCWGQNLHGQLGDGSNQNRLTAVAVDGNLRFRTLEAGGGTTCGTTTDGQQLCWGLNQAGQVGDGTRNNRNVPTAVGG